MVAVMEVTIMIRLSFEDDDEILSPSQKSEGLNLCWLLLKPELHKTISDLTSHILHGFQLHNSCPHGIHLYMDGFPLPPSESTGILSISDIISVRKRRPTLSLEASLKGQEARKYQLRGLEEGGNATSKKRKASANLHITKKKKQRSALQDSVQDDATANQVLKSSQDKVRSSQENIQTQEHNSKNKKQAKDGKVKITNSKMETSADPKRKKKQCSGVQDCVQDDATANKVQKSSHDEVESSQVNIQKQELNVKKKKQAMNGKDNINTSNMKISADTKSSDEIQNNANDASEGPMETKKTSRSARRKKAKRQSLRILAKVQKQDEIVQNGLQSSKETLAVSKADTSQPKSCNSRSARRKKAKRQWLQELAKVQKQDEIVQNGLQSSKETLAVLKSGQDKVWSSQENIQKQEHNPNNKKQAKDGKDKSTNSNMETSADPKSFDEIKNSANGALEGPVEAKKGSISAREKAAKRRWLWGLLKVEKQNEIVQNELKYSKKTLTLTKVDDDSQPESYQRETQPKSELKNRDGKRDDGEPKGLLNADIYN